MIHVVLAAQIAGEERDGETIFLRLSFPSAAANAGNERKPGYYLALTPQMLLATPTKEALESAIARLGTKGGGPELLANAAVFRRARTRFPESLNSFSYVDFTHFPWGKLVTEIRETVKKNQKEPAPSGVGTGDLLNRINLEVFRRHLHSLAAASWKSREGVFFDGYIE